MGDRLGSPLGAVSFLSPSTCRPGQCGEEEIGSYLALDSDLRIESGRGLSLAYRYPNVKQHKARIVPEWRAAWHGLRLL